MALFGKSDPLVSMLDRLKSNGPFATGELAEICSLVFMHPDLDLDANAWLFSHGKRVVRDAAAKKVMDTTPSPDLINKLIGDMSGRDPELRRDLAKLVSKIAPDVVAEKLPDLVHHRRPNCREAALELIARTHPLGDSIAFLHKLLEDDVVAVRERCLKLLAREVDNPAVFQMVRELINDEREEIREKAIEVLARRPEPEIVEAFFERLPFEGPRVKQLIHGALKRLARERTSEIQEKLIPVLSDENEEMRGFAIKLLREMPDRTHTLRTFIVQTQSALSWLKERGIAAICQVSDDIVESLVVLLQDEDEDVCAGALSIARTIDDPRIVPPVRVVMESNAPWWIRGIAVEILGGFPTDGVTEVLVHSSRDPVLRYPVLAALGQHSSDLAIDTLLLALSDPGVSIRAAALDSLRTHRVPRVIDALRMFAASEPENALVAKAVEALEHHGVMDRRLRQQIDNRKPPADPVPVDLVMLNPTLNS